MLRKYKECTIAVATTPSKQGLRLRVAIYPPRVPYWKRAAITELDALSNVLGHSPESLSDSQLAFIAKILDKIAGSRELRQKVFSKGKAARGRQSDWPDRDFLVALTYWTYYELGQRSVGRSKNALSLTVEMWCKEQIKERSVRELFPKYKTECHRELRN
jgi:hypothetical protein